VDFNYIFNIISANYKDAFKAASAKGRIVLMPKHNSISDIMEDEAVETPKKTNN
jgi:hypothetical protein